MAFVCSVGFSAISD